MALESYWVTATYYNISKGQTVDMHEDQIGDVELDIKTWQDMPRELEINGYTYKIEL